MRKLSLIAISAAVALAGCATTGTGNQYVPVVDTKGVDMAKFADDTRECQQYANQVADAARGAMAGAVAGALLGAFLAPRGYRNQVAGRTAVLGGLAGAGQAEGGQRGIISRCLVGRGYTVLN